MERPFSSDSANETSKSSPNERYTNIPETISLQQPSATQDVSIPRAQLCPECEGQKLDAVAEKARLLLGDSPLYLIRKSHRVSRQSDCSLCKFLFEIVEGQPECLELDVKLAVMWASWAFGTDSIGKKDFVVFATNPPGAHIITPGIFSDGFLHSVFVCTSENQFKVISKSPNYSVIREWVQQCKMGHHSSCKARRRPAIPGFQVIDCSRRTVVPYAEVERDKGYITLSYVWGTGSIEPEFSEGRLSSAVPLVIDDAITVTLSLGYLYLWVDRYCIPRNDPFAKHAQIRNMHQIYEKSELTIIAAAGSDSSAGLPGVSKASLQPPSAVTIGSCTFVSALMEIKKEISGSTWATRRWTYQEGLLSWRRLVFTESQVYFQCKKMHCQESLAFLSPEEDWEPRWHPAQRKYEPSSSKIQKLPRVFPEDGVGFGPSSFASRVCEYSRRCATYESDALDGFMGILSHFEDQGQPIRNSLGIPLGDFESSGKCPLIAGLSWTGSFPAVARRLDFPSWTWLGWKQTGIGCFFSFEFVAGSWERYLHSLVDLAVVFQDGRVIPWDSYMADVEVMERVRSGEAPRCLRIEGYVFTLDPDQFSHGMSGLECKRFRIRLNKMSGFKPGGGGYTCLMMGFVVRDGIRGLERLNAMIIREVGQSGSDQAARYERCGWVELQAGFGLGICLAGGEHKKDILTAMKEDLGPFIRREIVLQ